MNTCPGDAEERRAHAEVAAPGPAAPRPAGPAVRVQVRHPESAGDPAARQSARGGQAAREQDTAMELRQ